MYVAELRFPDAGAADPEGISDRINILIGALRMNGQVCGRESPLVASGEDLIATLLIPERDALDEVHANPYVLRALSGLGETGSGHPVARIVGRDVDSAPPCTCTASGSYILFTTYLSLESPLRCGDCFQPVPLYTVPLDHQDDFYDLIVWQSDYQACDSLQMNSTILERAATEEVSRFGSALSTQGRGICTTISSRTGVPTYYYLYRDHGRSEQQERRRRCPCCKKGWLLDTPWHLFDFRCDTCRILSNIAWDVR